MALGPPLFVALPAELDLETAQLLLVALPAGLDLELDPVGQLAQHN